MIGLIHPKNEEMNYLDGLHRLFHSRSVGYEMRVETRLSCHASTNGIQLDNSSLSSGILSRATGQIGDEVSVLNLSEF